MDVASDNTVHAKAKNSKDLTSKEPPALSESNQFNSMTLPALHLLMKMGRLSDEETRKKLEGATNKSDKGKLTMVSNVAPLHRRSEYQCRGIW